MVTPAQPQPPAKPVALLVPTLTGYAHPAGFASRLVAILIDIAIVTVGAVIFGALISMVLNFFGLGAQQLKTSSSVQILDVIRTITVGLSGLAVFLFVPLYFIVFWTLTGATPGKQVLGLRVVHPDHAHVAWQRGVVRFIGYFISALVFFLGFLWVLFDDHRQGWHDKMANTFVVYTWDVPPDE